MRFEIYAAAILLAGNFALVDRNEVAPPPPAARPAPIASHVENNPVEAAKLAALWMAHNAGYHPPVCAYHDPLAILDADVDAIPGREHVIGNRRYGVAMYSEHGVLIARMDPIGCDAAPTDIAQDQSISLGYRHQLVVSERTVRGGTYWGDWTFGHVVERRDDKLISVAKLMLDNTSGGGPSGQWEVGGRIYVDGDSILMKYHGRSRAPGAAHWEGVDLHCTLSRVDDKFQPDDPKSPCGAFSDALLHAVDK